MGVVVGIGAAGFVAAQHHITHLLWQTLPHQLGLAEAPAWLVVLLPILGALLTFAAMRLPGGGGHSPLDDMALDVGPKEVASVLLASLASLCFGAVLGPEAPLLAIGTAIGAGLFRTQPPARQVMMLVGAMAAIGAVFGNPLITVILLLEMVLITGAPLATPTVLLPALCGLGGSYLLQVGVGGWTGLGDVRLGLPGLPRYENVRLIDLGVGLVLAVVVAVIAVLARRAGDWIAILARSAPLRTLLAAGAITGGLAAAVSAVTGGGPQLILFAGQTAMLDYLALGSVATAGLVLLAKVAAYAACMGGGFRGGALFPVIAIGTILAVMTGLVTGTAGLPAFLATAIAAAVAATMRLPFSALLLGVLLTISAGPAITVPAILGAVVGLLVRMAADRRRAD